MLRTLINEITVVMFDGESDQISAIVEKGKRLQLSISHNKKNKNKCYIAIHSIGLDFDDTLDSFLDFVATEYPTVEYSFC